MSELEACVVDNGTCPLPVEAALGPWWSSTWALAGFTIAALCLAAAVAFLLYRRRRAGDSLARSAPSPRRSIEDPAEQPEPAADAPPVVEILIEGVKLPANGKHNGSNGSNGANGHGAPAVPARTFAAIERVKDAMTKRFRSRTVREHWIATQTHEGLWLAHTQNFVDLSPDGLNRFITLLETHEFLWREGPKTPYRPYVLRVHALAPKGARAEASDGEAAVATGEVADAGVGR